jgi:hypothetical protein
LKAGAGFVAGFGKFARRLGARRRWGGGGMTSIALVDLRENNGHVVAIVDDNENIVQFDNFDEIEKLKGNHPLSGFPWLAVDIDSEICWCMEEVK